LATIYTTSLIKNRPRGRSARSVVHAARGVARGTQLTAIDTGY